jgi:hypothetical protein
MRRGREVHQLDLGYATSSLSLRLAGAGVAAGDRMPDAPLLGAGGQPRRLFDLLRGPHWTLLARGIDAASLPMPRVGLRIHHIGADGEFRDIEGHLDLAEGGLLLIRPDGYIGVSATRPDGERIEQYLSTIGLTAS